MALSGSIVVKATDWDDLKFSWTATQSVIDNTSTVSWQLELISGKYGRINANAAKAYTIVVDGNTYSGTNYIGIANNATKTLVSGSTIIKHNDDGSRSFNFSFSQALKINFSDVYIGTKSGSGSGVLDDIPRFATLINAPDFSYTSIPQMYYSNPLGASITDLKACIALDAAGSNIAVGWQALPTGDSYYAFVISDAERKKLAEAVVGGTSTHIYYILSSTIGSTPQISGPLQRHYFIEDVKPGLSYTVEDTNDATIELTGDANKFVKFYSNLKYTFNPFGREYATISSQSVIYQGTPKTSTEGTFNGVESDTITFSATDSRAQTASKTVPLDVVNYVKLTCNLKADNPTTEGNVNLYINGNCFNGSFGEVNNTLSVLIRYKEASGDYGDWASVPIEMTNNGYNAEMTLTIPNFDYRKSYTVQAMAEDKLDVVPSIERQVLALPAFDWGENDFNFNVPIMINRTPIFDLIYPVGSIYMSVNLIDPSAIFGGTWERIQDTFLLAAGNAYNAGDIGGQSEITLTEANLPSHSHGAQSTYSGADFYVRHGETAATDTIVAGSNVTVTNNVGNQTFNYGYDTAAYAHQPDKVSIGGAVTTTINSAGSGVAYNNMPPYLAVFVWTRVG